MISCISCDRRVVDGALGTELVGALKALIENPAMMVVGCRWEGSGLTRKDDDTWRRETIR
jgi:hypothetical protein